jgi:hypothetical protein
MEEKSAHVRYHSPTVQVEEPLQVPKVTVAYPSKLPDVVKVRLKASAVAQQIAVALYKSPSAGFREIYSNECRAARVASKQFGADPRIELVLNSKERTLTVQGIDTLGITSEIFVEVLRYMGRTTNDQAGEVGQFGWGFFAVFTLTDELRLETYARETNERYGVTAESAAGFKPLPDEAVEITEYGTKITVKIKQQIHLSDLVDWIERYCKYSDVETNLTITHDIKDEKWNYDWVTRKAGRNRLDGSFKDQLRKSIQNDSLKVVHEVEVNKPDYYFYGAIVGNEEHARTDSHDRADLLLLQVPIESEDIKGFDLPLTGWVLNVRDERRYPPTPDRDRFKEGTLKTILDEIQSTLQAKFSEDFKLRSLDDYRRQQWRGIYSSSRSKASKFFDAQTLALSMMLNTNVARPAMEGEAATEGRYRYGHRSTVAEKSIVVEPLRKVVARTKRIYYYPLQSTAGQKPIMPAKRIAMTQKILGTKFEDAEVVTFGYPAGRYVYSEDDGLRSMQEFTATLSKTNISVDAKAEAEKIKKELGKSWRTKCGLPEPQRNKPPPIDWPIHRWTTRGRVEAERVSFKKIPADVIRVHGKIEPYIEILQHAETKIGITRDRPGMRGGTKLNDLLASLKTKKVTTQRGKMTFETIASKARKTLIYLSDNPEILKHYAPKGQFMVAAEGDEAVQLMFYLQGLNVAYITTRVPSDAAFRSKTGIDTVEDFVGRYLDIDGGKRATTAFIGSCELNIPELKELMLTAIEETCDPEKAETFHKLALGLEKTI